MMVFPNDVNAQVVTSWIVGDEDMSPQLVSKALDGAASIFGVASLKRS